MNKPMREIELPQPGDAYHAPALFRQIAETVNELVRRENQRNDHAVRVTGGPFYPPRVPDDL